MSDPGNVAKSLRERFGGNTEDRLGKALSDLLENPLLTGAIGRAFDARERASQAQEVALGALNIPSAADIERLTRRLRSVSHRLEGIEDGVDRLDRALAPSGVEERLAAIEAQLRTLTHKVEQALSAGGGASASAREGTAPSATSASAATSRSARSASVKAVVEAGRAKPRVRKAKGTSGAAKAAPQRSTGKGRGGASADPAAPAKTGVAPKAARR